MNRIAESMDLLSKREFIKEIKLKYKIHEGDTLYFEIVCQLIDKTKLYIIERWKSGKKEGYSYYWVSGKQVLAGWDNKPHHKELSTFPHHVHLKGENKPLEWKNPDLISIIDYIEIRINSK